MASFLAADQAISPELRFAYSQLYAQAHYHYMNEFSVTYFETKGGAYSPLVFEVSGKKYAFLMAQASSISTSIMRTIQALSKYYTNVGVIVLSPSSQVLRLAANAVQVPWLGVV